MKVAFFGATITLISVGADTLVRVGIAARQRSELHPRQDDGRDDGTGSE